jgi:hypothetical protein
MAMHPCDERTEKKQNPKKEHVVGDPKITRDIYEENK